MHQRLAVHAGPCENEHTNCQPLPHEPAPLALAGEVNAKHRERVCKGCSADRLRTMVLHASRAPSVALARPIVAGIALVSATLLMTELALTRIFSVTMYYHFAFLAISIALFGLSASGVAVYLTRLRMAHVDTRRLLATCALAHGTATLVSLACLVR